MLAVFRMRRGRRWTQKHLAPRIGADPTDLSDCEQGGRSSAFIANHLGLIADELKLTGQEILDLESATRADDFLVRIKARRSDEARQRNAHAFQALMILPVAETRQWLRVVFGRNNLQKRFEQDAAVQRGAPAWSRWIERSLSYDLVDEGVLASIRLSIGDACRVALNEKKPLSLEEISQMLLYWARSVANLGMQHSERRNAHRLIKAALKDLRKPMDPVAKQHLTHALYELGETDAMCKYLAETEDDPVDASKNLDYLVRRSADAGDGLQVLECALKFIASDKARESVSTCALDLRTTANLLTTYRETNRRASRALVHLGRAEEISRSVMPLAARPQPLWCTEHRCENKAGKRCHQLAERYARRILKEVAAFARTLPQLGRELKASTHRPSQ